MRMLRLAALVAVGLSALYAPARAQSVDPTKPIALKGATLIDGLGGQPVANSVVIIESGKISAVGPSESIKIPPAAQVIDLAGKSIIPGLISNHSHLGIVKQLKASPDNYNREYILSQLRQWEAYGVTSLTSLGLNAPLFYELRAELHAGTAPGSDIFGADRGVGVAMGAPPVSIVPVGPDQIYRPDTPDAARAAVKEMAGRKTDLIKVWLDDFGHSLPVKVKPEIYTAVVDEAHKNGIRVAFHINDIEDAQAALKGGADILAHGIRDKEVDASTIDLMKKGATWYIPTLALDDSNFIFADKPQITNDPFVQLGLDPAAKALFNDPAWREKVHNAPGSERARAALAMNEKNLLTLYKAGVNIGFGSDSGVGLRFPGIAEHRELDLIVESGLTPLQAITIATSNAAKLLKLDDRGVLQAGKLADIVVLDADPSANIANVHRISAVWHRGRPVAGPIAAFAQH
ncbi:amidohydrolase family protein [Bradyrhizobium sp. KB893862 SZCCT0404]|uniref:amidohydrolase family protein n=1 Tax=Bradyrhizobium sp. KB893862 SZCCT0404 TaxID=2807672 RepID=UPI001BA61DEE|nr:amidohydrolase family protein [Bradyrhizobium sp. KB893862 SZCCT0404]MBR1175230.1 amidohydrolase family protein [Bradyrhizobium sp. KB893862 SZCCT0404]